MLIKTLPVGQLETNCYVVSDEASLSAAIIDPGDESNTILDYLERNKLSCKTILLTHGHFDHVGAVHALVSELGAKLYMHEADTQGPIGSSSYGFTPPEDTVFIKEGDVIKIGSLEIKVMETPGHTPGGLVFICEDALFSGDTLFSGSCGRTDLPGGDMETLMHSLKRLCELEGDFEVYPGHMDSTTLDRERRFNYYMKYACGQE